MNKAEKEPHWATKGAIVTAIGVPVTLAVTAVLGWLPALGKYLWSALEWTWESAMQSVPLPLALVITLSIPWFIFCLRLLTKNPEKINENPCAASLSASYTRDEVEGVVWDFSNREILMLCPVCLLELELKRIGSSWSEVRSATLCMNCNVPKVFAMSPTSLHNYVMKELERRLRTGEFKNAAERLQACREDWLERKANLPPGGKDENP